MIVYCEECGYIVDNSDLVDQFDNAYCSEECWNSSCEEEKIHE